MYYETGHARQLSTCVQTFSSHVWTCPLLVYICSLKQLNEYFFNHYFHICFRLCETGPAQQLSACAHTSLACALTIDMPTPIWLIMFNKFLMTNLKNASFYEKVAWLSHRLKRDKKSSKSFLIDAISQIRKCQTGFFFSTVM